MGGGRRENYYTPMTTPKNFKKKKHPRKEGQWYIVRGNSTKKRSSRSQRGKTEARSGNSTAMGGGWGKAQGKTREKKKITEEQDWVKGRARPERIWASGPLRKAWPKKGRGKSARSKLPSAKERRSKHHVYGKKGEKSPGKSLKRIRKWEKQKLKRVETEAHHRAPGGRD